MKCNERSAVLFKLIILDLIDFEALEFTLRNRSLGIRVSFSASGLAVAQEASGGPGWASFSTDLGSWSGELDHWLLLSVQLISAF